MAIALYATQKKKPRLLSQARHFGSGVQAAIF
jgi:hypothetical protein